MDERRDLVDREELRRRIEAVRFDEVTPWRRGYRCAQGVTLKVLDAMPSVAAPKGWTRDEVLDELAKHPDNVCEHLDYYTGKWTPSVAVTGWGNPDVPRTNVRVVRSTPDPEWVPLTKLVGRTIVGEMEPVAGWWPCMDGEFAWCSDIKKRSKPLPVNLETGQVAVRPEAAT